MFGFRTLCISGALALAIATAAQAEVRYPTGLRVGLEPPVNTVASKLFPGFEDADRRVAITILDLPAGAYPNLEATAFAANQLGLQDLKRESFPFESGIGFLISGWGEANGVKLHKWFLVATTVAGPVGDLATLVSVEVPENALNVYTDAVVRKALSSVTFRQAPIDEQVSLLPFRLSEMAGFRVMQVMPGAGLMLTDGPEDNINTQPYVLIGVGRGGPSEPSDRGRFARDLLQSAPMRDLTITLADNMRINGGPGNEIRATAKAPDGSPVSLVQWVRFGSGGFMRIVGVSRTEKWDDLFPRFRALRDGIEPK